VKGAASSWHGSGDGPLFSRRGRGGSRSSNIGASERVWRVDEIPRGHGKERPRFVCESARRRVKELVRRVSPRSRIDAWSNNAGARDRTRRSGGETATRANGREDDESQPHRALALIRLCCPHTCAGRRRRAGAFQHRSTGQSHQRRVVGAAFVHRGEGGVVGLTKKLRSELGRLKRQRQCVCPARSEPGETAGIKREEGTRTQARVPRAELPATRRRAPQMNLTVPSRPARFTNGAIIRRRGAP